MADTRAPSHRRKRLGMAIRDARQAKRWSQGKLAGAAQTSQTFVSRLENAANVEIPLETLDRIITALGYPAEQAAELRAFAASPYDARGSWVESPETMGWWQQHLEVERDAREICTVSLNAVDGLLQNEPYMRRQFALARMPNLEARVRARLARQDAVLRRADPPQCTFVLYEACLRTTMGAPAVLRSQLFHLLNLCELPHVRIHIAPVDAVLPAYAFGFTLLTFSSTVMGDFVAVDYGVGGTTLDGESSLIFFQRRWDRLLAGTVGPDASVERIVGALNSLDE